MGFNTTASEFNTIAMGSNTTASGYSSVAIGYNSNASAPYSLAMGEYTNASGTASVAMGSSTFASAFAAVAIGYGTYAKAFGSISIGNLNDDSDNPDPYDYAPDDRIFQLGNGTITRSNAMTVLRNGNVGIGSITPAFKLDVQNGSINTDSLYRIDGATVLTVPGNGNLFVGKEAGKISTGSFNSFFGEAAGVSSDFNIYNALFGASAGGFNTSGSSNSFFGTSAGLTNTTGSNNTALGFQTYFSSGSLTNATAIGAFSEVGCSNCLVLGSEEVKVGIGTGIPLANLHVFGGASGNITPFSPLVVEGSNNTYINLLSPNVNETAVLFGKAEDAASGGIVYNNSTTLNGFQFRTNGNITRMKIYNDGSAWLQGTLEQASDLRLKKDLHRLENSLQNITQLNGYNYYWKNEELNADLQTGVIAQEVQNIFPELVKADAEGVLSVNYSGLIPVLIESLKEQQRIIENQQEQMHAQQKQIERQQNQIDELKQLYAQFAARE
jgi:hypothetical protein